MTIIMGKLENMKLPTLLFLSVGLLGCTSDDAPRDAVSKPNNQVAAQTSTGIVAATFGDIKPAGGLETGKPIKKGKQVQVGGNIVEVGTLGGTDTFVENINNGYIVGGSCVAMPAEQVEGEEASDVAVRAFVHKDGVITDLGTLGGTYSSASCVNHSGVVVGGSELTNKNTQAFIYQNSNMSALPNLSGGNHSWAYGINDSGAIVGEAKNASGAFKAVLWANGNVVELNSLLPENSGWELISAKSITNDGLVTGTGRLNGVKTFFQLNINLQ